MDIIYSTSIYRIYWYDAEQTILILDIYERWSWEGIPKMTQMFNEVIAEQAKAKKVYAVGMLSMNGSIIPQNMTSISQILQLIKQDPSDEELSFFVLRYSLLYQLIKLTIDLYKNRTSHNKYIIVETLENAIQIIEEHKMSQSSNK